jgi:DNA-binding transcriptional ArsR family regulator
MNDHVLVVGHAVGHPVRLALLRALGEHGSSLTDVAAVVGVARSTAHHHLAVLTRAGMVERRYRGREAIYTWKVRWSFVREPDTHVEASRSECAQFFLIKSSPF